MTAGQRSLRPEEDEPALRVGGSELFQHQPAEQPREHADGQEEARPARYPLASVWRDPAARDDHVQVRMVGERRAPGVQPERGSWVLGYGAAVHAAEQGGASPLPAVDVQARSAG